MIPDGWKRTTIGNVSKVTSGGTPSRTVPEYWNGEIPWVTTGLINFNIITEANEYITTEGLANSSAKMFPPKTLLVALYGDGVTRGKVAMLGIDAATNQACAAILPNDNVLPEYAFYYIAANYEALRRESADGNQKNLSGNLIKQYPFLLPPLPEQQKIAAILSTWDRAIELTEKLIAAKLKRKQALMQQLLTGKVRLPGFNKEWSVRKAGELFGSRSIKKHPDEPVLSVTQDQGVVRRDELDRKINMDETTTGTYKLVEPEDFVISLRSFQGGLEMSRVRGIVSPAYHVIRPKVKLDSEYFRHFFKSAEFIGRLAVAIIGIRDGKQIAFGDFSFLNFRFPPVEEQAEIGRVLTLAENEIELSQKKLDSLHAQKRGLMQQLLTGRVRVNTDQETVKG